jgi:hypothetical protein
LENIVEANGYDKTRLRNLLESLAEKGLVIDVHIRGAAPTCHRP